jgi:endo-alpha-1,4-polygalactosaminidase (GH114 family)
VSASLSAATTTINSPITLAWSSTNAMSCGIAELSLANLPTHGAEQVTPTAAGQFTYTIRCIGAGGSAEQAVSLDVPPPPTVSLQVNPSSGLVGQTATLSWTSTKATACTASGAWSGSQATSGSQNVTPSAPGASTYGLSCSGAGGAASASATLTEIPSVTTVTQATVPLPASFSPSSALSGPLSKVRSFEYVIAANQKTAGIDAAIAGSAADLIILGGGAYNVVLNRGAADPSGTKLIFGYLDVAEAAVYWEPQLFAGSSLPSWFGNQNPAFPGLYTVQYWNPNWEPALFPIVDELVADGFDGIFLDVLSADNEWSTGNPEGNPVYANATSALTTLVNDIRAHIRATFPGKTVYLIGNNPRNIAMQTPSVLNNLDAIFNEVAYFRQSASNGSMSSPLGNANAGEIAGTLASLYGAANVPIFGNDYPSPLTDTASVLESFDLYSDLGWVPSVTTARQTDAIFTTGPFMFMATPTNPAVSGTPGFTNYLSGGAAPTATLTGADQGDFFVGGPGQNTIVGGPGNDTIYAHPAYAAYKGLLIFSLSSTIKGSATTPSVAIAINGETALAETPVTASYGTGTQVISVALAAYPSISSVTLTVTNTSYTDQANFSNVEVQGILFNGVEVNLQAGTYSSGGSKNGFTYSNNGTVTFPAAAFPSASPYLTNTSDTIDGGAGTNTVVYRSASSYYTVTKQPDGSWVVVSGVTAEGPDTLKNIQSIQFSDKTIPLSK